MIAKHRDGFGQHPRATGLLFGPPGELSAHPLKRRPVDDIAILAEPDTPVLQRKRPRRHNPKSRPQNTPGISRPLHSNRIRPKRPNLPPHCIPEPRRRP